MKSHAASINEYNRDSEEAKRMNVQHRAEIIVGHLETIFRRIF